MHKIYMNSTKMDWYGFVKCRKNLIITSSILVDFIYPKVGCQGA